MNVDEALEKLRALADPTTIEGKAAYQRLTAPILERTIKS